MKNLEKDRLENKINGYLAIVAGLVMMFAAPFSDNKLGFIAGIIVGVLVCGCGFWLTRMKAVYWSPTEGFTPKQDQQ